MRGAVSNDRPYRDSPWSLPCIESSWSSDILLLPNTLKFTVPIRDGLDMLLAGKNRFIGRVSWMLANNNGLYLKHFLPSQLMRLCSPYGLAHEFVSFLESVSINSEYELPITSHNE